MHANFHSPVCASGGRESDGVTAGCVSGGTKGVKEESQHPCVSLDVEDFGILSGFHPWAKVFYVGKKAEIAAWFPPTMQKASNWFPEFFFHSF